MEVPHLRTVHWLSRSTMPTLVPPTRSPQLSMHRSGLHSPSEGGESTAHLSTPVSHGIPIARTQPPLTPSMRGRLPKSKVGTPRSERGRSVSNRRELRGSALAVVRCRHATEPLTRPHCARRLPSWQARSAARLFKEPVTGLSMRILGTSLTLRVLRRGRQQSKWSAGLMWVLQAAEKTERRDRNSRS
jgi:hypothetical protein